jgi:hypothetical protein
MVALVYLRVPNKKDSLNLVTKQSERRKALLDLIEK